MVDCLCPIEQSLRGIHEWPKEQESPAWEGVDMAEREELRPHRRFAFLGKPS